ncbi:MAG: hypothetical protein K1X94_26235 [Sandaracinaceae bacterium]|nr:hypothetical protein [Sandaracinaceae bacterium]
MLPLRSRPARARCTGPAALAGGLVGALTLLGCPVISHAQEASRAAHALGVFADSPAILVADDRAYVPAMPEGSVSVCSYASGQCAPIHHAEACSGERCPSGGLILHLERSVASVGELPTDRDGLARMHDAVRADRRIAMLDGYLPQPAPPAPPPSLHLHEGDWRFEVTLGGGIGLRPETTVGLPSIFAALAFHVGFEWDNEEILQLLFGNVLGGELRVRVLPGMLGTSFDQLSVMVGASLSARWGEAREPLRVGAFYFSLLPELGVITHPTLPPAFYFGWSYPVSLAVDSHVGLELRPWFYVVDDWVEGDDAAYLLGIDLDVVLF